MWNFVKFCRFPASRVVARAIFRDGSSGGLIRTMFISEKGLHRDTTKPKFDPEL